MPRGISRYDEAALQGRLWTPNAIQPLLWLDASDLSTISSPAGISEWRDKSGNAWHASQATQANRPTHEAFDSGAYLPPNAINTGRPAVAFDGINNFLELPSGFLHGATTLSVAMLLRGGYFGNNTGIFGPSNAAAIGLEFIYFNGSYVRINAGQIFGAGLYPTTGAYSITTMQASSSQTSGENNGTSVLTNAFMSPVTFNGVYAIGRYAGGNYAPMRVCEFLVSRGSWSSPQRLTLQGYLAWKWNMVSLLPGSHPFANRPPLIGD